MKIVKRFLSFLLAFVVIMLALFNYVPNMAAAKPSTIPQIAFASAPVTEYTVGDRVKFNIYAPNYGGRVEYRVILWNDSKKSYSDLWYPGNGYPTHYYSSWQPYGNNIFTLGWPIFEPGYYRITVCVKRVGIKNSQAALKGMNCDSYMESVAFLVKPKNAEIQYIMPIPDITIRQGEVQNLPGTANAVLKDGTQKSYRIGWERVDTTKIGAFIITGSLEGVDKKVQLRLIVTPGLLNVYTAAAANDTCINVILKDSIMYTPDIERFKLRNKNNTSLNIYSLGLSQDRKVIQLAVEKMVPEEWYKIMIDGKEYSFQVPIFTGSKVVIKEIEDIQIEAGKSQTVNLVVYPEGVLLRASSINRNVATAETSDKRVIVKGVDAGSGVISIFGNKNGFESSTMNFNVYVNKLISTPDRVDESLNFDNTFILDIKGYGNINRGFDTRYITLGGDFSGLRVASAVIIDAQPTKAVVRLTGNMRYNNGYGTITISPGAWNGPHSLTARVNVIPTQQAAKPVAIPNSGQVDNGTGVVLVSATSDSRIYYTIDGTNPTINSTRYINPIIINKDMTIKAIAVRSGMKDSEISTFKYTLKQYDIYLIKDISAIAAVFEPYTLPKTVDAIMSNNSIQKVSISWTPPNGVTIKEGKVTINSLGNYKFIGKVNGYKDDVTLNLEIKSPLKLGWDSDLKSMDTKLFEVYRFVRQKIEFFGGPVSNVPQPADGTKLVVEFQLPSEVSMKDILMDDRLIVEKDGKWYVKSDGKTVFNIDSIRKFQFRLSFKKSGTYVINIHEESNVFASLTTIIVVE